MSYSAILLNKPYFLSTYKSAAASFPQRARVAGLAASAPRTFSSIPAVAAATSASPAAQRPNSNNNGKFATTASLTSHNNNTMSRMAKRTLSSSTEHGFRAWRVDETDDGRFVGSEQGGLSLPNDSEGVLIQVTHSSLNYKDALSASGNKGVTRNYPHTPGIDAAGTIVGEHDGNTNTASVLVTGYDLGMNTDGGFGEFILVPPEWIVTPNPFAYGGDDNDNDAAARISMVYGTAGLTAGLSVQKLLASGNAKPSDGKVLVTGATGGVGSIAVELLAKLGFEVVALTGKAATQTAHLLELGASEVVGREALAPTKKPMLRPLYAHAIDTVGGSPLAEILKQIRPGGSVTACGNAAGMTVETNVLPFILRGVQLLGVDSVEISLEEKKRIWQKLSGEWRCPKAEALAKDIGRDELDERLTNKLEGKSSGKFVLVHGLTTDTTESGSTIGTSKL